jgi:hypothetical protein
MRYAETGKMTRKLDAALHVSRCIILTELFLMARLYYGQIHLHTSSEKGINITEISLQLMTAFIMWDIKDFSHFAIELISPWHILFTQTILLIPGCTKKSSNFYGAGNFINVFTRACHWFLS